jgi:hypothetical protein
MSEGKETVTILPLIAARLKEERGKCEAQSKKRDLNRKSESLGDQDVRKGNERRRSDDIWRRWTRGRCYARGTYGYARDEEEEDNGKDWRIKARLKMRVRREERRTNVL